SASPGTRRHESAYRVLPADERRRSSSVAEANDENFTLVHERILLQRIERRSIAVQFRLEVCLCAVPLALSHSRHLHPHGREAGLLNQPPEDRSKSVRFSLGILYAVAAQPAHKENHRNFATGVFRTGHNRTDVLSLLVRDPVVLSLGILESFSRRICRANRLRQRERGNNEEDQSRR